MYRKLVCTGLLAAAALTSGCALSRSEVPLASPAMAAAQAPVSKKRIVLVRSVRDERQFAAEAPADPSVPSLKQQGTAQDAAAARARAFARKRNGFNQPLGDVLLPDGQTVAGVVQENVVAAFRQAGYRTTFDPAEAGPAPLVVDVHIRQFWAWTHMGFWSGTLTAEISTDIGGAPQPLAIKAHAEKTIMAATDSDWTDMMNQALTDFREQLRAKAAALE